MLDLAISHSIGGDCLVNITQPRLHPEPFGPVVSDPTVFGPIDTLAHPTVPVGSAFTG